MNELKSVFITSDYWNSTMIREVLKEKILNEDIINHDEVYIQKAETLPWNAYDCKVIVVYENIDDYQIEIIDDIPNEIEEYECILANVFFIRKEYFELIQQYCYK